MKRMLFCFFAAALFLASVGTASAKVWFCDEHSGNGTRSLYVLRQSGTKATGQDYFLADGDTAFVTATESGVSVMIRFTYVAASTASGNTVYHPFRIRPVDFGSSGVWLETMPTIALQPAPENLLGNSDFGCFSWGDIYKTDAHTATLAPGAEATTCTTTAAHTWNPGDLITLGGDDGNDTGVSVYVIRAVGSNTTFDIRAYGPEQAGLPDSSGATPVYLARIGRTDADMRAFDGWSKSPGLDVYREPPSTASGVSWHYTAYLDPDGGGDLLLSWPGESGVTDPAIMGHFSGNTITFTAQAKTSTASDLCLLISDGVTESKSSYHTGQGTWESLSVTHVFSDALTGVTIAVLLDNATAGEAYVRKPYAAFGFVAPGTYNRPRGEIVTLERPIDFYVLDPAVGYILPDPAGVVLDMYQFDVREACGGRIPAGLSAAWVLAQGDHANAAQATWVQDTIGGVTTFAMGRHTTDVDYWPGRITLNRGQFWLFTKDQVDNFGMRITAIQHR